MARHTSRNTKLPGGVDRLSRSGVYKKKALYKVKKVSLKASKDTKALTKEKTVGGDKNGGKRVVPVTREGRFYPTEDISPPLRSRKKAATAKLRGSITPGTVLIMLSGPFRGKRVVFLKQLASGLLLITGPHKMNGVPLRRVNQAYVIATSYKIDISSVSVDAKFDDAYFKRPASKQAEGEFFDGKTEAPKTIDPARKADQKTVDSQIMGVITKVPNLRGYLKSRFTLTKGQYPHEMVF